MFECFGKSSVRWDSPLDKGSFPTDATLYHPSSTEQSLIRSGVYFASLIKKSCFWLPTYLIHQSCQWPFIFRLSLFYLSLFGWKRQNTHFRKLFWKIYLTSHFERNFESIWSREKTSTFLWTCNQACLVTGFLTWDCAHIICTFFGISGHHKLPVILCLSCISFA